METRLKEQTLRLREKHEEAEVLLEGHCKVGKKKYRVGETWMEPGKCELRACHPGGLVSVLSCPRFLYDKDQPGGKKCRVVEEDPEQKFPDCCKYVYCRPKPTSRSAREA